MRWDHSTCSLEKSCVPALWSILPLDWGNMSCGRGPHQITLKSVVSAVVPMRSLSSRFTAQSAFDVFVSGNERTAPWGRAGCLCGPGSCFCQCLWLDASEEGKKTPQVLTADYPTWRGDCFSMRQAVASDVAEYKACSLSKSFYLA